MNPSDLTDEAGCRELCEKFRLGLTAATGELHHKNCVCSNCCLRRTAMSALSEAVRIMREKMIEAIQSCHIEVDSNHWHAALKRAEDKIRALQLTAEDIKKGE